MQNHKMLIAFATVAALSGFATTASAQDLSASADLVRATVDGHAYQNGGIGVDEVHQMRRQGQPYDLHLIFSAGKSNDYITGLKLKIKNAIGDQVFALDHAGPLTDVSLPAGSYLVTANHDGVTRNARVEITPGSPSDVYMHWSNEAS